MRAYAILDGGGVKGAALAGCLKAAEELDIEFAGYGGTSAGSIVALLASVGYAGDDLERIMIQELDFQKILDDQGVNLKTLKGIPDDLRSWKLLPQVVLWRHRRLLREISSRLGLYTGDYLQRFLLSKIKEKHESLRDKQEVTFEDLKNLNRPLLKVMVSDLGSREPKVYSGCGGADLNGNVIDAIRASTSYPLVFRPVPMNNRYLVDGGLSCNLPLSLFEAERRRDNLPVIAFDLVQAQAEHQGEYSIKHYFGDMLATALESTDHLLLGTLKGVHHVTIPVPQDIDTLDFDLPAKRRQELFTLGKAETHSKLCRVVQPWRQATNMIERLQAVLAPPRLVVPILQSLAREVEVSTSAQSVRANVMLPT